MRASLLARVTDTYARKAADYGETTDIYRPLSANTAISDTNKRTALNVFLHPQSDGYNKPMWHCVADISQLQVGDYLVNSNGTFFIHAIRPAPVFAVRCNAVIDVKRPVQQTGKGAAGYNADVVSTEVSRITAFPASILAAGTGDRNATLPSDTKYPQFSVLLPNVQNVEIRTSDIINDDIGRRFIVISAELTDLGWRLIVMQAVA